ncbi:MAG: type II toxin-antitoxin system ParD family antitoxin [Myxococcota bacterium]
MRNTSITLGEHFEGYVKSLVESGTFRSVSEVVRDALRLHEGHRERNEALRAAIHEGLEGPFRKRTADDFKRAGRRLAREDD